MRRIILLLGMFGLLGAGAASAQTRARISVGFGGPALSGYVVVGHPWYYSPYRRGLVLVRPYGPPRRIVGLRRARRGEFFRRDFDRDDYRRGERGREWRGERHHRGW